MKDWHKFFQMVCILQLDLFTKLQFICEKNVWKIIQTGFAMRCLKNLYKVTIDVIGIQLWYWWMMNQTWKRFINKWNEWKRECLTEKIRVIRRMCCQSNCVCHHICSQLVTIGSDVKPTNCYWIWSRQNRTANWRAERKQWCYYYGTKAKYSDNSISNHLNSILEWHSIGN